MTTLGFESAQGDGSGDVSTTSTSFVNVAAAAGGSVSLACDAGDKIMIHYTGHIASVSGNPQFSVNLGAVTGDVRGTNAISTVTGDNVSRPFAVQWPYEVDAGDLVAGVLTVQMRWRSLTGAQQDIVNGANGVPVLVVARFGSA